MYSSGIKTLNELASKRTGFNNQYGGDMHISDPKELRYVVGDSCIRSSYTIIQRIGVNETSHYWLGI